jgi:hypothetical protein
LLHQRAFVGRGTARWLVRSGEVRDQRLEEQFQSTAGVAARFDVFGQRQSRAPVLRVRGNQPGATGRTVPAPIFS